MLQSTEEGGGQMDAAAWVGVAGIIGTLTAALLTPVISERMRRRSARDEQFLNTRLEVYSDLLRVTASLSDNAMTWAAIPLANLKEADTEEIDRLLSRVRVVAGKDVFSSLNELTRTLHEFNSQLFNARLHHQQVHNEGFVDDSQGILQRVSLGGVADTIRASHKRIEAAIRREMRP